MVKNFVDKYKPEKMREIKQKIIIFLKDDEPAYQRARREREEMREELLRENRWRKGME